MHYTDVNDCRKYIDEFQCLFRNDKGCLCQCVRIWGIRAKEEASHEKNAEIQTSPK